MVKEEEILSNFTFDKKKKKIFPNFKRRHGTKLLIKPDEYSLLPVVLFLLSTTQLKGVQVILYRQRKKNVQWNR